MLTLSLYAFRHIHINGAVKLSCSTLAGQVKAATYDYRFQKKVLLQGRKLNIFLSSLIIKAFPAKNKKKGLQGWVLILNRHGFVYRVRVNVPCGYPQQTRLMHFIPHKSLRRGFRMFWTLNCLQHLAIVFYHLCFFGRSLPVTSNNCYLPLQSAEMSLLPPVLTVCSLC